MGFKGFVVFVLFVVLLGTLGFIGYNLFMENVNYNPYISKQVYGNISGKVQFYPNMRYTDKDISYSFEDSCTEEKMQDVNTAFSTLSDKTVLEFHEVNSGEIEVYCSEIPPEEEKSDHFIAGEGGPVDIINVSRYSIIEKGKISFFRDESCDEPKVALHEILHALGFDHNSNPDSIMYPVSDCDQELDNYIIADIEKLYSEPAYPDLAIDKLSLNKTGVFLNFNIKVGNHGLRDADDVVLSIYSKDSLVKKFPFDSPVKLGTSVIFNVENMALPINAKELNFTLSSSDPDLDYKDNSAWIDLSNR